MKLDQYINPREANRNKQLQKKDLSPLSLPSIELKSCPCRTPSKESPEVIQRWEIAGFCSQQKSNVTYWLCSHCQQIKEKET